MGCDKFKQSLLLYVDQEFSEINNIDQLEQHLLECSDCLNKYNDLLEMNYILKNKKDEIFQGHPGFEKLIEKIREIRKISDEGVRGDDLFEIFESEVDRVKKEQSDDEFASRKIGKAKSLIEQGKQSEAIECLEKALIVKPNNYDILIELGDRYYFHRFFDKALDIYGKLEKISTDNFSVLSRLGEVYFRCGEHGYKKALLEKSISSLEKANMLEPNHPEVLMRLSSNYLFLEQFEKAEEVLENTITLVPKDVNLRSTLGAVHNKLKHFEKAKNVLEKANELDPNAVELLCELGSAYIGLKRFDKAECVLEKANRLVPNTLETLTTLGCVYLGNRQFEKAKNVLEKAYGLDPKKFRYFEVLGQVYLGLKEYIKAKIVLEKVDIRENDTIAMNDLGFAYLSLNEHKMAKVVLERANELDPDGAYISNNLACCYYFLGDSYRAQHFIEMTYKLDSESWEIQHNRDIILGNQQGELLFLHSSPSGLTIH